MSTFSVLLLFLKDTHIDRKKSQELKTALIAQIQLKPQRRKIIIRPKLDKLDFGVAITFLLRYTILYRRTLMLKLGRQCVHANFQAKKWSITDRGFWASMLNVRQELWRIYVTFRVQWMLEQALIYLAFSDLEKALLWQSHCRRLHQGTWTIYR